MSQKFKMSNGKLVVSIITIVVGAGPVAVLAQQAPSAEDSAVQQASFARTSVGDDPKTVRFGQHSACVGDRVDQQLTLEMRMTTWLRQGNQIVEKSHMRMCSDQHRIITTTAVAAGRSSSVIVRYLAATRQLAVGEQSELDDVESADGDSISPTVLPVQGKAYRCRREGGEGGKLLVTNEDGTTPPRDEYEIVAQNMEMVGRANPLAELLGGQAVTVGQTISLPPKIASRIFNLGERFGEVNRFELTLKRKLNVNDAPYAEFLARVDAASNDSSQMRLQVEGPLIVQTDTCRAMRMELSGPMGLSESRGSYSTTSHLLGTGRMTMRVASTYGVAKR